MATIYAQDGASGNGLTAETPASFASVMAAFNPGDTIRMTGTCTVPHEYLFEDDLTIEAHTVGALDSDPLETGVPGTTLPCRFTRNMDLFFTSGSTTSTGSASEIRSGVHLTLKNMRCRPLEWPDFSIGEKWTTLGYHSDGGALIGAVTSGARLTMQGVEGFTGYGEEAFAAYDPARLYKEQNSPPYWKYSGDKLIEETTADDPDAMTGHGETNPALWSRYNTPYHGPKLVDGYFTEALIEHCYMHDMAAFLALNAATEDADIVVRRSMMERWFEDAIRIGLALDRFTGRFLIEQNLFRDAMTTSIDNYAGHCDVLQGFSNKVVATSVRMQGHEFNNNVYLPTTKAVRAYPQMFFNQASGDHQRTKFAYYDGMKHRNNVGIAVKKMVRGLGVDVYVRNLLGLNPPWMSYGLPDTGADIKPSRNENSFWSDPSKALADKCLVEEIGGDTMSVNSATSVAFNKGRSAAELATWFADPSDPGSGHIGAQAMWNKFVPTAAYSDYGPQVASLRALLTEDLDFTGERPWLAFMPLDQQVAGAAVTSDPRKIFGGDDGDILTLTVPAGVEWQMLDTDLTTVLTARSSAASGPVTVGKYLEFFADAPSAAQTQTHNIALDGSVIPWTITAQSDNVWPVVHLDGAHANRGSANNLAGVDNSKYLSLALRYSPEDTTTRNVAILGTGNAIALTAGTATIRALLRKAGVTGVTGSVTSGMVVDGGPYIIAISIDLEETLDADGRKILIDKINKAISSPTWNPAALTTDVEFDQSGARWNLLASSGNGSGLKGDFSFLWMSDKKVIWTEEMLNRLTPDYIGPNGEGIDYVDNSDPDNPLTVTDTAPPVFIIGKVDEMNSLVTANRGTGGNFPKNTGASDATVVVDAPWPPPLVLTATVQTPGPYEPGQPISVLVQPVGYAKPGVNIIPSANLAGTWGESETVPLDPGRDGTLLTFTSATGGALEMSFDTDTDYINPDPLALTVAGIEPEGPTTGSLVRLGIR